PAKHEGQKLRHVIEVRHDSFLVPEFVALLRELNMGVVYSEHETYPEIADPTADFVYLRLQKGQDTIETGYPKKDLDAWAKPRAIPGRRGAERSAAGRCQACGAESAARRIRLRDPRGQGARARRRDGADRAAQILSIDNRVTPRNCARQRPHQGGANHKPASG